MDLWSELWITWVPKRICDRSRTFEVGVSTPALSAAAAVNIFITEPGS